MLTALKSTSVAYDSGGYVYVGGSYWNSTDYDYRVIKYDSSGGYVGVVLSYDGGYDDYLTGIAVSSGGTVYATGSSASNTGGTNCLTVSTAAGWGGPVLYNGGHSGNDEGTDIVLAGSYVYITGFAWSGPSVSAIVMKVDASNASVSWQGNSGYAPFDFGRAITVDGSGNVYVAAQGSGTYDFDMVTFKFNSSGTKQWTNVYDSNSLDEPTAIAVDGSNDVYVSGESGLGGNAIKITGSTGSTSWNYLLGAASFHVVVSGSYVYFAGTSSGVGATKYTLGGTHQWTSGYAWGGSETALCIAVDGSGNVYATGWTPGASGTDVAYVKLNSSGTPTANAATSLTGAHDYGCWVVFDGTNAIVSAVGNLGSAWVNKY